MNSYIKAIEYYFPKYKDFNNTEDRLTRKVGISSKYLTEENEFASDLAVNAASKLFEDGLNKKEDIDFLLYCTQSPDYYLPTTACIIQEQLGLNTTCGALDFNLGCSGYVYGLALANGQIVSGQANNVLLITSETYSKYVNPKDRSVQLLFGDAAAATIVSKSNLTEAKINSFVFGTNGKGAANLIVPAGGLRNPLSQKNLEEHIDEFGNVRSPSNLYMNGTEIFTFALKEVPKAINALMLKEKTQLEDYDYFIFHQANKYMIETLRRKIGIPKDKFSIEMEDCGNTVSSTIPIALKREVDKGNIKTGDRIMLVGFGVGYSWAACSIVWD